MEYLTPSGQDDADAGITHDFGMDTLHGAQSLPNGVLSDRAPQEEPGLDGWWTHYEVTRDHIYGARDGRGLKLDLYRPHAGLSVNADTVVMFIHGGCWIAGTREDAEPYLDPFLEMGMTVANVDYRLAGVAHAPAAIEDCRLALLWLVSHPDTLGCQATGVIVAGVSAGGHLALMTGILGPAGASGRSESTAAASLAPAQLPQAIPVKAILNWSGMTDVADLLSGPNRRDYAEAWFGNMEREPWARLVSPLHAVRHGMPPVLTIHGTADPVVPFSHALRLQDALTTAGVRHQFLGVPEAGHGEFSVPQASAARQALREFLFDHDLVQFPHGASASRSIVDEILARIYERRVSADRGPSWRHSTAASFPA